MLGIRTYTQQYVNDCRSRVEERLVVYRTLRSLLKTQGTDGVASAIESFEASFFMDMVLLLDYFFVHRLRTIEGKDGNALNEVRVLCNSILTNRNVMLGDKTIKLSPDKSLLKYQIGEEIRLNEPAFLLLCESFLAEIEGRYR